MISTFQARRDYFTSTTVCILHPIAPDNDCIPSKMFIAFFLFSFLIISDNNKRLIFKLFMCDCHLRTSTTVTPTSVLFQSDPAY